MPGSGGCSVTVRRGEGLFTSELWILKIFSQNPPIRPLAKNRPPTLKKGDPHVSSFARAPPGFRPLVWASAWAEAGAERSRGKWDGRQNEDLGRGQWPGGGRRLRSLQVCPQGRAAPLARALNLFPVTRSSQRWLCPDSWFLRV